MVDRLKERKKPAKASTEACRERGGSLDMSGEPQTLRSHTKFPSKPRSS
ncbi:hypothetical protein COLO4_34125 [Corchorus olitorius]|uniref:Uncharacterized protein n=1 Tax=Corchorus olitorius TaxID=93759 RepID=A0A1R3GNF1_9ROSI|nr:hypothetical protein COLO4_34125 [Corchorus olitorius]